MPENKLYELPKKQPQESQAKKTITYKGKTYTMIGDEEPWDNTVRAAIETPELGTIWVDQPAE